MLLAKKLERSCSVNCYLFWIFSRDESGMCVAMVPSERGSVFQIPALSSMASC